jgi:hypothetical protein
MYVGGAVVVLRGMAFRARRARPEAEGEGEGEASTGTGDTARRDEALPPTPVDAPHSPVGPPEALAPSGPPAAPATDPV